MSGMPPALSLPGQPAQPSDGLGFERVHVLPGSTYRDVATVVVIPTRGMLHWKFVQSKTNLIAPMNAKRCELWAAGDEVGHAYNRLVKSVLDHSELSKWPYLLTIEDDNIVPPDAHIRLLESIEWGKFDAVSGIYFTKGDINLPMAYGDPAQYKATGAIDFRPRDIREALAAGQIMPVNGIGMGCALWRMDLFREIPAPWFVTVSDVGPSGPVGFTQDLYFCKRAVAQGKTFAVDLRVRVGHLDINSGVVF